MFCHFVRINVGNKRLGTGAFRPPTHPAGCLESRFRSANIVGPAANTYFGNPFPTLVIAVSFPMEYHNG